MKYRLDIDGLRSIAVMSVVLYHAKIPFISGGFIGVDIFFVISGYLITKIIHNELMENKFSIAKFYMRRIRRILPALFCMFVITTVLASMLFFSPDLEDYGKSIIASTLFVSNIYFWQSTDYFSNLAETAPLLHTWSLAVEEQFYIFFPLILIFVHKKIKDKYVLTVVILAIASFLGSVWMVSVAESTAAAFYLSSSRAWELLIGSLIAIKVFPTIKSRMLIELVALIGLGLLFFGFFAFSKDTPFPGVNALIPCLGAAFIIYAGEQNETYVGRLLSLRPLVFIGLISYSLYLWHWPIIVLYSYFFHPNIFIKVLLVLLSIITAILSWHFVEKPWRKHTSETKYSYMFGVTASLMAAFVAVGLMIYMKDGLPGRYSKEAERLAAYVKKEPPVQYKDGICYRSGVYNEKNMLNKNKCLVPEAGKKNYLLIGDSHADHLWGGLSYALRDVNIMQATASGCKSILNSPGTKKCTLLREYVFNTYLPNTKIDALLISGRWVNEDLPLLLQTLSYLRKYVPVIYVFGPTVEYRSILPRLLALSNYYETQNLLINSIDSRQVVTDEKFKSAISSIGINYISTYRTLCTSDLSKSCKTLTEAGVPYEYDYGHFTSEGSKSIAKQWVREGLIF